MSLNGKIASKDGSVDWLESIPNPNKYDYGYSSFFDSISTTIQGYSTYKQIIDWGIPFPYKNKDNYVITRKQDQENTDDVTFISSNHANSIKKLKEYAKGDIWLIGGGQINTLLLNEQLIDEIRVFIMPIILADGISLFEALPSETHLSLVEVLNFSTGVIEIKYKVEELNPQ